MTDSIAFAVRPHNNSTTRRPLEVVPVIEGVELTDRIDEFERERGMEVPGSYGGLIPEYFEFGSATDHYFATEKAFLSSDQKIPLLGCECGEWGCWPLLARVVVDVETVTWTDFEQPHRADRDYSAFGPFIFRRSSYESAVADLADTWATASSDTS